MHSCGKIQSMNMMKEGYVMKKSKILLAIVAMTMASTFAGCGSNQKNDTPATLSGDYNSQSQAEDNTVEPEPKTTQEKSGVIDDFAISIENAEVTKSSNGKKAMLVTYSVTNNSQTTIVFNEKLSAEAYQNDTACLQASMENQNHDVENMLSVLKPGETKKIYEAYLLQDDSDVTVRVCKEGQTAEQENNDTTMITRTFKVK